MMYNYHLQEPIGWTAKALEEVVYDLFPRKVSAGDDFYGNVEPVLSAYFAFLDERKYISNGKALIKRLAKAAAFMRESASDTSNWGPAKQLVMEAQGHGVDLHDELARERFIQRYNQSLNAQPAITEKVGRNDPCPCGSGKKFKKCCGAPDAGPPPLTEEEIAEIHKDLPDVYRIKVMINGIEPLIWRRLLVPSNITFTKLHKIIQAVFGWHNYHLFNFMFKDTVVYLKTEDDGFPPEEMYRDKSCFKNAWGERIDALLRMEKRCVYEYDFGDNWEHEIVLEKIEKAMPEEPYPVCLDGARNRPPENVGGVHGYEDFLAIISDPKHEEYEDMLLWAEKDTGGRKFDPEYFYLAEINRELRKIK